MLVRHGVPVSRCIQSSREFVVVFSGSHYSNVSCGYTLSESVHYATQSWIPNGYQAAKVSLLFPSLVPTTLMSAVVTPCQSLFIMPLSLGYPVVTRLLR